MPYIWWREEEGGEKGEGEGGERGEGEGRRKEMREGVRGEGSRPVEVCEGLHV